MSTPARRTPLALLDWFLSPKLRGNPPHELRRARVLVGASLLMQVLLAAVGLDSLLKGLPSAGAAFLGAAVWASLLPLLRFGHDRLAGLWISSYAQLAMLYVVLHRDAMSVLYDPWQGVMIMTALYFVGTGFGAAALGLALVEMIAIPILGDHGLLLSAPFLRNNTMDGPGSGAAFLAIFALGWLYASAKNDANRAVEEALATLSESREEYRLIAESTDAIPFTYNMRERCLRYIGAEAVRVFGLTMEEWMLPGALDRILSPEESSRMRARLAEAPGQRVQMECRSRNVDGQPIFLRLICNLLYEQGVPVLTGFILDITELRRMETELRQAQKLESVGRLAAGVAHEINTPVQFISDSVHFLDDAVKDLTPLFGQYQALERAVAGGTATPAMSQALTAAREAADLDYLLEQLPRSLERSLDGLDRISTIVRSMREFAHPDQKEMAMVDLNRAIESTLTIAQGEYKLVADAQSSLGKIPLVLCYAGEINQVLLNIIVNAAHAIEDVVRGTDRRGQIRIESREEAGSVLISISDTGKGIPEGIREHIFDPFFTTKEVGRGTGQGLAIARSVVQDKHGGQLTFTSELGVGTTFTIRLPIAGAVRAQTPLSVQPVALKRSA